MLWIARTGSPWRNPPERSGNWSTTFRRCCDWREEDVFSRRFDALSSASDVEYDMIDATIVMVYRHGKAQKGVSEPGHPPPRGGMTTKTLGLTDVLGKLDCLRLTPGQRADSVEVPPLIDGVAFDGLIADRVFDGNALVADLKDRRARIVISPHPGHARKLRIDAATYACRQLIENSLCKLKEFKRIAMRASKSYRSFDAVFYLIAAVINSP